MGSHYLPQQYLRGFEVPSDPGTIWVYDKKLSRFKHLPIKVVAQEPGFYDQSTEKALSENIEGPANTVLAALRKEKSLDRNHRLKLALYISAMIMRVPRRRRKAREMVPSAIQSTVDRTRNAVESLARRKGTDRLQVQRMLNEIERVRKMFQLEPPPNLVHQIRSPWPSEKMVRTVYDMVWRIVRAPANAQFLTGDNPAFFFEGFGLGTPRAELTFPIASDLALFGCWQGHKADLIHIQARPVLVRELNRRVASGSERFVFFHSEQAWVATVADKQDPHLSEIRWQ